MLTGKEGGGEHPELYLYFNSDGRSYKEVLIEAKEAVDLRLRRSESLEDAGRQMQMRFSEATSRDAHDLLVSQRASQPQSVPEPVLTQPQQSEWPFTIAPFAYVV